MDSDKEKNPLLELSREELQSRISDLEEMIEKNRNNPEMDSTTLNRLESQLDEHRDALEAKENG